MAADAGEVMQVVTKVAVSANRNSLKSDIRLTHGRQARPLESLNAWPVGHGLNEQADDSVRNRVIRPAPQDERPQRETEAADPSIHFEFSGQDNRRTMPVESQDTATMLSIG